MHGTSKALVAYGQDPFPSVRAVSGKRLASELKGATAIERALASADLQTGRLVVSPLRARAANFITDANQSEAKAARGLLPLERAAARRGDLDLTKPSTEPSDDQVLDRIGEAKVFAWLEKRTRPTMAAE
jgi:hypothetical protein